MKRFQILFLMVWNVMAFRPAYQPYSPLMKSIVCSSKIDDLEEEIVRHPKIIFPGGGIFFYWQAGAVTYLRDVGYELEDVPVVGASAGALMATLTAYNVDFEEATELALSLCDKYNVWERPLGLFGIWGCIIEEWLDTLLPDSIYLEDDKLSILLTTIPFFEKSRIDNFFDKKDLIACNMASVHLPWFLNKNAVASFRGTSFIDGSFMSKIDDYCSNDLYDKIILDWSQDPIMEAMSGDFVRAIGNDGIWSIFHQGRKFAAKLDNDGTFKILKRKAN